MHHLIPLTTVVLSQEKCAVAQLLYTQLMSLLQTKELLIKNELPARDAVIHNMCSLLILKVMTQTLPWTIMTLTR